MGKKEKVITLEDRIPKLKQQRRHKSNRRLILYISVFFLLILVIVYFQSPLSKVGGVHIEGNHFVSNSQIKKAGHLQRDDGFWDAGSSATEKKIERLDEVKTATVHKQFPNHVRVSVREFHRVAYLKTKGHYYPILENGAHLPALGAKDVPADAPVLVNWHKKKPLQQMAAEVQKLSRPLLGRISEIAYTPSDAFPDGITVYMNDGFEVRALIDHFAKKIKQYPEIISQLDPKSKGVIHMRVSTYFSKHQGH